MNVFECHITVEKPHHPRAFEALAERMQWKTSCIDGDPLLGKKAFFYFTTHAKTYEDIFIKMKKLSSELGPLVLREKIEHIVYDSGKKLLNRG